KNGTRVGRPLVNGAPRAIHRARSKFDRRGAELGKVPRSSCEPSIRISVSFHALVSRPRVFTASTAVSAEATSRAKGVAVPEDPQTQRVVVVDPIRYAG